MQINKSSTQLFIYSFCCLTFSTIWQLLQQHSCRTPPISNIYISQHKNHTSSNNNGRYWPNIRRRHRCVLHAFVAHILYERLQSDMKTPRRSRAGARLCGSIGNATRWRQITNCMPEISLRICRLHCLCGTETMGSAALLLCRSGSSRCWRYLCVSALVLA